MQAMAEQIPNATYVQLDDVGHFGRAERPVTYLDHLLRFLHAEGL